MDQNNVVSIGSLLSSIASTLGQSQGSLNGLDSGGSHGTRVAQAFDVAAQAAQETDTQDAGEQLLAAAQAMRQQGKGKAVGYYANGLEQAASEFQGKSGITANDLLPLLQSLAGGVQQNNPAKQGQGTMLDAFLPAVSALTGSQQQGADPQQGALQALSSALNGARGTAARGGGQGSSSIDPGAASATGVLGGIFQAVLPGLMSMAAQKLAGGSGAQQRQIPSGQTANDPMAGAGGLGDLLGGLLGGATGGLTGQSPQPRYGAPAQGTAGDDPLGGLGGLLGGLLGGSQDDEGRRRTNDDGR